MHVLVRLFSQLLTSQAKSLQPHPPFALPRQRSYGITLIRLLFCHQLHIPQSRLERSFSSGFGCSSEHVVGRGATLRPTSVRHGPARCTVPTLRAPLPTLPTVPPSCRKCFRRHAEPGAGRRVTVPRRVSPRAPNTLLRRPREKDTPCSHGSHIVQNFLVYCFPT